MIATDNHKTGATYFNKGATREAVTLCEESLYYKGGPFKGDALIRDAQGGVSLKGAACINNDFPNNGTSLIRPYFLNKEIKLDCLDLVGCLS